MPPSTITSRKNVDKSAGKSSGVITVLCTAMNAPAKPASAALITKACIFRRTSDAPTPCTSTELSCRPSSARPKREKTRLRTNRNAPRQVAKISQ